MNLFTMCAPKVSTYMALLVFGPCRSFPNCLLLLEEGSDWKYGTTLSERGYYLSYSLPLVRFPKRIHERIFLLCQPHLYSSAT